MQIKFYFKQMEESEALNDYTKAKFDSLIPMVREDMPINVRYESHQDRRKVHVSCVAKDHGNVRVSVVAGDMFEAIDRAADKLSRILSRRKERRVKIRTPLTTEQLHGRAMKEGA